jgi:hypothetical protein
MCSRACPRWCGQRPRRRPGRGPRRLQWYFLYRTDDIARPIIALDHPADCVPRPAKRLKAMIKLQIHEKPDLPSATVTAWCAQRLGSGGVRRYGAIRWSATAHPTIPSDCSSGALPAPAIRSNFMRSGWAKGATLETRDEQLTVEQKMTFRGAHCRLVPAPRHRVRAWVSALHRRNRD